MSWNKPIHMVDLHKQYLHIKEEIDEAILRVVASTRYIGGPEVAAFEAEFASYLGVNHVISCANGTDALQLALMALGLQPGDEVIVPAFSFIATAEVVGLLDLKPVMIDVDHISFNITPEAIRSALTPKTKAVIPVHLFGQCCDMAGIMEIANEYDLYVIEDNAQSTGAVFTYDTGLQKAGTIGHIGCTSFFPSKNLGCFGDGGAIYTNDNEIASRLRMIANHGQNKQYYHEILGVNSRLDAIQAALLRVKLRHLDDYCQARRGAAKKYTQSLAGTEALNTPEEVAWSTHVYHQFTLQTLGLDRDKLRAHLREKGIPSMIYYPVPLYRQNAFKKYWPDPSVILPVTEELCKTVLSLPMHTELEDGLIEYIAGAVKDYCLNR